MHKNRIVIFVASFILLFGGLYGFNYLMVGLTIPGGYYNHWVAEHFDYVSSYRTLLLKGAAVFTSFLGFENFVDRYELHLPGISRVRMVYSCIGFDVLCFWIAFTVAYPQRLRRKVFYVPAGIVVITLLNMMRVGGLAMIRSVKGLRYVQINHHLIFNVIVYVLIFIMISIMIKSTTREQASESGL